MATHLIGYDIHPVRGETYSDLIAAIKRLGNWWHHLNSTWFVISSLTAVQIRDMLRRHLPYNDDQLLVLTVSGDAGAWAGFNNDGSNWLQQNL